LVIGTNELNITIKEYNKLRNEGSNILKSVMIYKRLIHLADLPHLMPGDA
jgi:hypothetical protein